MSNSPFQNQIKALGKLLSVFGLLIAVLFVGIFYVKYNPNAFKKEVLTVATDEIPDDLMVLDSTTIAASGFVNDDHVSLVIQNCTNCHSSKLVTQNRMSEAGWDATITWMQETQNLWELGNKREKIIAYLAKNYSPQDKGRRQNLTNIEWYELE